MVGSIVGSIRKGVRRHFNSKARGKGRSTHVDKGIIVTVVVLGSVSQRSIDVFVKLTYACRVGGAVTVAGGVARARSVSIAAAGVVAVTLC